MTQRIKVLLADDHPMFLDGVRNALLQFPHIEVIAECTSGEEVLAFIEKHPVDVAVLDVNMPVHNGVGLSKIIYKDYSHIKVIFLTMYHPSAIGNGYVHNQFTHGYVLKNSGSQVLSQAIEAVYAGSRFLDPKLQDYVPREMMDSLTPDPKLSKREKEIIKMIADGKGNKEIAEVLFLSELTIKTHRKNIYQKLAVNNVAALIQKTRNLDWD